MKNIIKIVGILIFLNLSAMAQNSIFGEYNSEFQKAKILYDKKEYKKAFDEFIKLDKIAPDDPKVNFYLGRCALELKMYDEALAAFDRVLMLNPNHTRTKLEIARLYYETGAYDLADTQLDLVLKENIPESVKANILKFKATIAKRRKRNFISSSIAFGLSYDDNANNDIGNIKFIIPLFNVPVNGNPKKSDTAAFANINISDLYYFKDKHWSLSSNFLSYISSNKNFSENNSLTLSLSSTPTYTDKRYQVSFPLNINKVLLGSTSYSHSFQVGTTFLYMINPTSNINFAVNYGRFYNENDSNQNSKTTSVSLVYKKVFGENPIMLSLFTGYAANRKVKGTRTDINSDNHNYGVNISKKLFSKLYGSISYSKSYQDYKDRDTLFLNKRKDREDRYSVSFNYNISKTFITTISASHTKHSSNQAPFNYDKNTYSISITKSFDLL